jgi:hypothetical protein
VNDTGYISQNVHLFCASEKLVTVVRGLIDRPTLAKGHEAACGAEDHPCAVGVELRDAYQASASDEDIELWTAQGRADILQWVCFIPVGRDESGEMQYVHDIRVSPGTGEDVDRCPWLRKLPKRDKCLQDP